VARPWTFKVTKLYPTTLNAHNTLFQPQFFMLHIAISTSGAEQFAQ
jgi:hypothetical protein